MYDNYACFKCGQPGHLKANCPSSRTPAAEAPAAAPAIAVGSEESKVKFQTDAEGRRRLVVDIPGYHPGPVADSHRWADMLRQADPRMGDGAARERRLRALAAEQAAEARQGRTEAAAA